MESLTASVYEAANELIDEVEAMGGMTKAIEVGMPKLKIEEAATRRQARIDTGEDVIVGVNKYRLDKQEQLEVRDIDNTAVRDSQIRRLEEIRASRDAGAVDKALAHIGELARSGEGNLLEAAVDAARVRAGRLFSASVIKHVDDIAERYIVPGETSDSALMFIPSGSSAIETTSAPSS